MTQLEESFSQNIIKACYGPDGLTKTVHKPEVLLNYMIQNGILKKTSIRDFTVYAEFNRLMALRQYRNKTVTVEALSVIFKITPSTVWAIIKKAEAEGPTVNHQ
ncbi:MAG: hypothetical protein AAF927_02565 [Bacteroidota bacterium]